MKVAVVTSFPKDPRRPRGGVEAVSVNLVRALASFEDLDLHVVTTDRTCVDIATSEWQRARIHRLPWIGKTVLHHATWSGRPLLQSYLSSLGPDLIHAHDFYGIMVKGMPIPRVFTIHGFIYADTFVARQRFSWLRSKIWKWAETSAWADQDHIVSISPYVRERLAGIATGVIHDIDNPISETFFQIERAERPGTIFSAASIGPRKNTLTLIEAFARIIDGGTAGELRLAGAPTDTAYAARLNELIRLRGLEARVVLLGTISTDQIREELARASAFALVSLEENSPMGIEEAMAASVPVVTSNRCGMPYMVRDGETGYLVDPNDVQDIADRLGVLLADLHLRKAMGERARQIAEDRFHPRRVAERTREVYLSAARRHKESPVYG